MPEPGSPDDRKEVAAELRRINEAWLEGRPQDLVPLFHEDIVMVFPGFGGRAEGRAAAVAGFEEFCTSARVTRFETADEQIDVVGAAAVASFRFEVTYERAGARNRSTGRDLWVFTRHEGRWLAIWRTMLDPIDEPLDGARS